MEAFIILMEYVIGAGLLLSIIVMMQPNNFRTSRSISIAAPASVIFPQISNLRNLNEWNPWAKIDPSVIFPHINNLRNLNKWNPQTKIDTNAKTIFEGPADGVGAIMSWDENPQVGKGIMTVTECRPDEFIQFRMDFLKPFKATNTAEFTLKQDGNQTIVSWGMYGKSNFMGKAINLVMNYDKVAGSQFEKGLASLKAVVEGI